MAVRAGGATDPADRILKLIEGQERRFRVVFLRAIVQIRDYHTLDALADLLERGAFAEALQAVDVGARLLGNAYGEALSTSARNTAEFLSRALTVEVSFDQTNFRAVSAIQRNQLRLVREFTADQRAMLRNTIADGITEGINPREQAKRFRENIGLTARQERAVANYRRLLGAAGRDAEASGALQRALRDKRFDRTVQRAIRDGAPLTGKQIETMTEAYRRRYIKYRAETIARTEALRSAHEGSEEMYQQAMDSGALDPGAVVRTWVSARDERVRDSHRTLNGQQRAVGEAWVGTSGAELRYPGDPAAPPEETVQCRCVLTTRLAD